MSQIKVGDIVELKNGTKYQGKLQNEVTSISDCGDYLRVNDNRAGTFVDSFKLVDQSKWHKHHDLIIAWAKGASIQLRELKGWVCVKNPCFVPHVEYRIKPSEPTELENLIKEHKAMGKTIDRLTKELKDKQ